MFASKSKQQNAQNLSYKQQCEGKTQTVLHLESLIEHLHVYREDFKGKRTPVYQKALNELRMRRADRLRQITSKMKTPSQSEPVSALFRHNH